MSTGEDAASSGQGPDFNQLKLGVIKNRWWILAAAAASFVVCGAIAIFMTPIYGASAVLMSTTADRSNLNGILNSSLGGLASLAGLPTNSADPASEEALAVLNSREFTESFIAENNLIPVLFARRWFWLSRTPTPAKAAKYFDKHVRNVTRDKKTGLVTVEVRWRDRNVAAAWASELVERLNTEMSTRAKTEANAAVQYLEQEASGNIAVETRDAISKLIEEQIRRRMLASVNKEYSFRIVDKPLPPDADDMVRPNRPLLLIGGPFVGAIIALAFIAIRLSSKSRRKESEPIDDGQDLPD